MNLYTYIVLLTLVTIEMVFINDIEIFVWGGLVGYVLLQYAVFTASLLRWCERLANLLAQFRWKCRVLIGYHREARVTTWWNNGST